jgi:crotonobetainyl-CoA:carnitine CoA-transferase CaiB-like acyl-CoA transferase
VEHEESWLGPIRTVGSPIHLSGSPMEVRHAPPAAGEHNEQILRDELGYDDDRIATLVATGVLWGDDGS